MLRIITQFPVGSLRHCRLWRLVAVDTRTCGRESRPQCGLSCRLERLCSRYDVDSDRVLEVVCVLMEMDVEDVPTGGEQQPRAPTTTISTISVHSGETRIVIALLQVSCTEFELGTL